MAEGSDHAGKLHQYALDVTSGAIPACKWVRLSAQRHLDDLKKSQEDPNYPFYWDAAAANRICKFAELLPHVKGAWGKRGDLIVLGDWQCFTLGVPFGWKKKENKRRRFREIYDCIPRKNGKSVIGAIISLYMLVADGEFGAEVYSGATTERQAWEVFGPAQLMMRRSPDLLEDAGLEVGARAIVRMEDNSKFQPVIGKPGDGASPSCAIIDEFHEHVTSELYDTMNTGMGAREQPMLCIITTAGTSLATPCYIKHKQAERMLEGVMPNDDLFAIMFTIDEEDGDDWASPDVLKKANPNYGISVDADFLASQQRNAVMNQEYQNRFKTKHLNVWCTASVAAINLARWRACTDAGLQIEEFAGQQAVFALDLASKVDVCAYIRLFFKRINGELHYYPFGKYYLPQETINEVGPNSQAYRRWATRGFLTETEGAEIDFDRIREDVKEDARKYQCLEVVYDPWRATQLAHQLASDGATVVEFGQTAKNMGEAFDELLAAIKSGRFHHDGNPVLEWMAANVIAKPAMKGVYVPGRDKRENKIDGIVALVMAVARALASEPSGGLNDWIKNPVHA